MRTLYGWLLKLYPARFREEYAAPMERQFGDEYREAEGRTGRVGVGLRALADLAVTWPVQMARETCQDLRHARRVYRRRPLAAVMALAALALSIGATTGVFSVVNALMSHALPFQEPERLVELPHSPVNVANGRAAFRAWHQASAYLMEAAGYAGNEMNLVLEGGSVRVRVAETTANFFSMLGTQPELGRGFRSEEDAAGRNRAAVIGHALWQQAYGGEPGVVGSTIRLNGMALTVVGVAPAGFDYPEKAAVWTPTAHELELIPKSGAYGWQTIGRLRRGVGLAQARALFDAEVARALGGRTRQRVAGFSDTAQVVALRDKLAGPVGPASLALLGLVLCLLLIACANVALLLLTRTAERSPELAVRAALGASRARLRQQLVTEASVLTVAAAAAGLVVAHWTAQVALRAQPAQFSGRQSTVMDWRVMGFAIALALLTGVVFGVLPASLIGRDLPEQFGIRAVAGGGGRGARRMRGVLIAVQAGLTLLLAAGAFSMGRSFVRLLDTDLAFRADGLITLNVSLAGTGYDSADRRRGYYEAALEQLRAVRGVEGAAAVSNLPLLSRMFTGGRFQLESGEQGPIAVLIGASPGYFRTMGTALLEGREFRPEDGEGAERVVIVSEELARSFNAGPVAGRRLNLAWRGEPRWATIVGVVRSQRFAGPVERGGAQVYRPIGQAPPESISFVARVSGKAESDLAACRAAVQRSDPDIPVYDVQPMEQRLADALARPRFYTNAILGLGGLALLLVVVGAYGVAAHSVAQRRHEIGVRIALGASPKGLRLRVFGESMLPVAIGILCGCLGASALDGVLRHFIAESEPVSRWVGGLAAPALVLTVSGAVWLATRRMAGLDPAQALRSE